MINRFHRPAFGRRVAVQLLAPAIIVAVFVSVALDIRVATINDVVVKAITGFPIAPVQGADAAVVAVVVGIDHTHVADHLHDGRDAFFRGAGVAVVADHLDQFALVGNRVADILGTGVAVGAVAVLKTCTCDDRGFAAAGFGIASVNRVIQTVVADDLFEFTVAGHEVAGVGGAKVAVIAGDLFVHTPASIAAAGVDCAGVSVIADDREILTRHCDSVAIFGRASVAVVAGNQLIDAAAFLTIAGFHVAGYHGASPAFPAAAIIAARLARTVRDADLGLDHRVRSLIGFGQVLAFVGHGDVLFGNRRIHTFVVGLHQDIRPGAFIGAAEPFQTAAHQGHGNQSEAQNNNHLSHFHSSARS